MEDIDGSLVQVKFARHNRLEWIYRGSSRLSPLFEEEKASKDRLQNKSRATRSTTTVCLKISHYCFAYKLIYLL